MPRGVSQRLIDDGSVALFSYPVGAKPPTYHATTGYDCKQITRGEESVGTSFIAGGYGLKLYECVEEAFCQTAMWVH